MRHSEVDKWTKSRADLMVINVAILSHAHPHPREGKGLPLWFLAAGELPKAPKNGRWHLLLFCRTDTDGQSQRRNRRLEFGSKLGFFLLPVQPCACRKSL